jgi:hypothetical protein
MLGRTELRRGVIAVERMGKVEPSPLDIFRPIHCLCQAMKKPASQMAIALKRIPMFLIDPLTISPEFVLRLVDCAPGLTDEEHGNAGLVMLNVLLSPEEVAELVEDGSELVPDAEAAAGSYKMNEHGNGQRVSLLLTLFVGPAEPSSVIAEVVCRNVRQCRWLCQARSVELI